MPDGPARPLFVERFHEHDGRHPPSSAPQSNSQKSLIAVLVEQMARQAPFDRMERDHLVFLGERFKLGYYAKGEVLIGPGAPPPDRLFIIKQGAVLGEQDVAPAEHDSAFWELGPWESCPLGALLAKRPVASVYRAKEDTFCYELPEADFHRILHLSEPFHDFCTRRLASLLEQSKHIFSVQKVGLRQISAAIRCAADVDSLCQSAVDSLCQSAHDIRQFAINMLAQGVGSEQLTEIISTFNDLLTTRVIELTAAEMGLDRTPVAERDCWMALGSEGRYEQTLSTDQDNGLIFETPEGWTPDQVRERLLPFAWRVNEALDTCGFPLCKGGVMASSPQWCLSLDEWRATFSDRIQRGDGQTLLNASIVFDFRPLSGEACLCDVLRQWRNGYVVQYRMFLRRMVINALGNRPPLGVVRDFVTSAEGNTLDLKLNGTTPFVDASRVMALYAASAVTGTVPRLRAIGKHWNLEPAEVEGWAESFLYIQMLRLRSQCEELQRGEEMDNRIDPDGLNDLDRRILKEAFRQARKLQALMEKSFQF